MKTIRCFLAVDPSLETARVLSDAQIALRDESERAGLRVRWVPPQNLHVTLRFLGQLTEPMIRSIQDALEPIAERHPPFEMRSSGLGAFPDIERPRVIWLGVETPEDELRGLHDDVAAVLDEIGFESEPRPFHSHLTLGRVKKGSAGGAAALAEMDPPEAGTSLVRELVCYRSDLHTDGADYRALWRLRLRGHPRGGLRFDDEETGPEADGENETAPDDAGEKE
ncbi:MAG: RNA 2',3'-cyclic phosphodiesterase [Polyangia bacterium]